MKNKPISIRKRLLVTLIGLIGIAGVGIFVQVNHNTTHELEEIYDASLVQNARVLFGLLQQEIREGEEEMLHHVAIGNEFHHPYELNIAYWANYRRATIQTRNAPRFLTDLPEGFSNNTIDGVMWRVFTLRDNETGLVIRTAQKLEAREELVAYLIRDTLSIIILILPLLGLLVWWGIGRSLKPLKHLMDEAGAMDPHSLRPFNIHDAPAEISPLIVALNQLLERLNQTIENEQRFTSDAAHELRTPLAGLKVQLQVALRSENHQQKTRAMNKALEGVDRTTHLVNQLLTLARADSEGAGTFTYDFVDLVSLAREVLSPMTEYAMDRGITLNINSDQPSHMIRCEPTMIQIAIRNLLENAIKYSPAAAEAGIEITSTNDSVMLTVWNTGDGIPKEALDLMFQRFKRGEQNAYSGSGLGLSIVKRIAEIHDAEIEVDYASELSGFRISMRFKQS